jgi:hypothetical protein
MTFSKVCKFFKIFRLRQKLKKVDQPSLYLAEIYRPDEFVKISLMKIQFSGIFKHDFFKV